MFICLCLYILKLLQKSSMSQKRPKNTANASLEQTLTT